MVGMPQSPSHTRQSRACPARSAHHAGTRGNSAAPPPALLAVGSFAATRGMRQGSGSPLWSAAGQADVVPAAVPPAMSRAARALRDAAASVAGQSAARRFPRPRSVRRAGSAVTRLAVVVARVPAIVEYQAHARVVAARSVAPAPALAAHVDGPAHHPLRTRGSSESTVAREGGRGDDHHAFGTGRRDALQGFDDIRWPRGSTLVTKRHAAWAHAQCLLSVVCGWETLAVEMQEPALGFLGARRSAFTPHPSARRLLAM